MKFFEATALPQRLDVLLGRRLGVEVELLGGKTGVRGLVRLEDPAQLGAELGVQRVDLLGARALDWLGTEVERPADDTREWRRQRHER